MSADPALVAAARDAVLSGPRLSAGAASMELPPKAGLFGVFAAGGDRGRATTGRPGGPPTAGGRRPATHLHRQVRDIAPASRRSDALQARRDRSLDPAPVDSRTATRLAQDSSPARRTDVVRRSTGYAASSVLSGTLPSWPSRIETRWRPEFGHHAPTPSMGRTRTTRKFRRLLLPHTSRSIARLMESSSIHSADRV